MAEPWEHAGTLAATAVVVLGPVPLGMVLAGCGPAGGRLERCLALLVGWCAVCAALGIGLAVAGLLARPPLLLAEGVLFVTGMHVLRRQGGATSGFSLAFRADPHALAIVAAIAVLGVDLGLRLVSQPLVDSDSLGYHLPALARWVQAGALVPLERTDQVARYPYTWELVAAPLVLASGRDLLVAAPNLIAWAILGLAIAAAARRLGAPPTHAATGALCVLAMELTRHTLHSTHVDLALAACFVSSVAFALAGHVAGWATALALVAGLKTNGILLAAVGAVAGGALGLGARMPRRALAVVAPALAVGSFWYLRNLLETENPLGLVRLTVHGWTLLPGSVDSATLARTTLAATFDPADASHRAAVAHLLDGRVGLPGVLLAIGALGFVIRPPRAWTRDATVVAALLVACTALYATTPFGAAFGIADTRFSPAAVGENLRYALPAIGLLGVAGAAGAARFAGPGAATVAALLVFGHATSERTLPALVLVSGCVALVRLLRAASRRVAWGLAVLAGLAALAGWAALRDRWDEARARAYGVGLERTLAALPAGTVVAHVGKHGSYPLFGPRLTNVVRSGPAAVDGCDQWIRDLRSQGVSFVALGPLRGPRRGRPEVGWLADPGGPFERIAGTDPAREIVLYRLH